MHLPANFRRGKSLDTLVENKTTYTLEVAEMNIFETHETAQDVWLKFDQPVLAGMIKGKKIMHLKEQQAFSFLPGESLMLPSGKWMNIDFPDASMDTPTLCLALTISEETIEEVLAWMQEHYPKVDDGLWTLHHNDFHFSDDRAVYNILHRLIYLCTEEHPAKDLFFGMTVKELLIRLLQAESRNYLLGNACKLQTNHRIAFIIEFIRANLQEKHSNQSLSDKACMSESHFYRVFKQEIGMSPRDYINHERLKLAANLLMDANKSVADVYTQCGFQSSSYFHRLFKKKFRLSPKAYQSRVSKQKLS